MDTNTTVSYTLRQRTVQDHKRREREIYLELWNALSDLLAIPATELTHEQTIQMDKIANLLYEYENKLYPLPKDTVSFTAG
ncbi:hypothetical protein [Spirosoma oryzicola]|uniref:hypothetical protein n=1 Tax=Spirosoma oryzicola TaxID=2898794 RepID=UPI001E5F3108|nr:hypothetical protein [Spirosoma oryzicola]UHG90039.1 hypothetical protein LQ777_17500 [Spirosoma oryzicola]